MAIVLRPMESQDFAYVKDSTRKCLLGSSAYCKDLHPATLDVILDPILAAYNTMMAVDEKDPSEIVGFVIYRSATDIAFVYVRSQFRRKHIGRALLAHAGIKIERDNPPWLQEVICPLMVTNLGGQNFPRLAERKGYRLRYRPYTPIQLAAEVAFGRKAA